MAWCCTKTGTSPTDPVEDCAGLAVDAPQAVQMILSGFVIDDLLWNCDENLIPQISGIPTLLANNAACPCVFIKDYGVDDPCYTDGSRLYFELVEVSNLVVWQAKLFVPTFQDPIAPCESPPDLANPSLQLSIWRSASLGAPPAVVLGSHQLQEIQRANPPELRGDIYHDPNSIIDIVVSL